MSMYCQFRKPNVGLLHFAATLKVDRMSWKLSIRQPGSPTAQISGNKTYVRNHNSATRAYTSPSILGTIPSRGEGIRVGQFAELRRSFTQQDVHTFGVMIGDMNPLHFPDDDTTQFADKEIGTTKRINGSRGKPIVHGMLLSSLFSAIFGTLIPGAIYRSQSIKFNDSICVGETVIGRVIVRKLKQVSRNGSGILCMCDTIVVKPTNDFENGKEVVAISGEAQVWLPGAKIKSESVL